MLDVLLLVFHVLFCIALIISVLLQSGKGGGLAAGLGGGTSSAATQVFGGRGAGNFLSKSSVILATLFMLTSLTLAYLSSAPRTAMDLTQQPEGKVGLGAEQIVEDGTTQGGSANGAKALDIGSLGAPPADAKAPEVKVVPAPAAAADDKAAPAAAPEADKAAPATDDKAAPAAAPAADDKAAPAAAPEVDKAAPTPATP
jgi:preprotein translocase subunit SecG